MQAWVEIYGILLLLLPFCALVFVFAVPFVAEAWASGEVSPSPGGLPARWLIKAALPAGVALLALAYVSRLLRVSSLLFGTPAAVPEAAGEDG
jgi:TRAP-type mannitol/chloroaromatic compound transport system permease small subunit